MPRHSITTPEGIRFPSLTALVRERLRQGIPDSDITRECRNYNPNWGNNWVNLVRSKYPISNPVNPTVETAANNDTSFDFDPTMKFGVEFEVLLPRNLSAEKFAEKMTAAGVECKVEAYNHDNRRHWKLTTDASLHSDSNFYGMELVSPILKGLNDLNEVKIACEKMTEMGCKVNKSCGFHVHHASEDHLNHKTDEIARISAVLYKKYQRKFNAMLPVSRRNSQYAQSLTAHEVLCLKNGIDYISTRYKTVNVQAFVRHGTVEFRQHSGTIDKDKALNWIKLTMAVVRKAKEIHKNRVDAWTTNFGKLETELNLHPNIIKFIDDRVQHFARREMGIPEDQRLRENVANA